LDRTNLNFSVTKNFMNEKLTLNVGSAFDFGMSAAQEQAAAFQFLPDINASYKITADGRVSLTLFYRDSYNALSANHNLNSSGTSISYHRDFDRIDELFKKKKKKKAPKVTPPPKDALAPKEENTAGTADSARPEN
jgi:hypothetical protein